MIAELDPSNRETMREEIVKGVELVPILWILNPDRE